MGSFISPNSPLTHPHFPTSADSRSSPSFLAGGGPTRILPLCAHTCRSGGWVGAHCTHAQDTLTFGIRGTWSPLPCSTDLDTQRQYPYHSVARIHLRFVLCPPGTQLLALSSQRRIALFFVRPHRTETDRDQKPKKPTRQRFIIDPVGGISG